MENQNSPLLTAFFATVNYAGPQEGNMRDPMPKFTNVFVDIAMVPKLFTWPWGMRGLEAGATVTHARHQREVGLSVPLQGAGQWEEAYQSVYVPGVRVCTRCAHSSKFLVQNNTHSSSPLIRPSHSAFHRVYGVTGIIQITHLRLVE